VHESLFGVSLAAFASIGLPGILLLAAVVVVTGIGT
jgi:hypothetical protein